MCCHGIDALFHTGGKISTMSFFPFPVHNLDFLGSVCWLLETTF